MAKNPGVDLHMEAAGGGLKELVLRWFTETQAPLIMKNGSFPDWFQGLAARKDAEDLLRDKALGCFLIRLSDKAIGYILSYKGHERCRHFVIKQNQDGQFVIAGDCQLFGSLTELIDHYKVSPIEPFGECLTSSCQEEDNDELYDVIHAKERPGVSVHALRSMWDHKDDHQPGKNQRIKHHDESPSMHPPVLPFKSKNRKLTGTVSVDAASLSKGVPPVPKRSIPLGFLIGGSLPDSMPHPNETQEDSNRQRLTRSPNQELTAGRDSFTSTDTNFPGDLCPAGVSYAELNHGESRSRSLPQLNINMGEEEEEEEEEENSNLPGSSSSTAPLKKVTCLTYSLHAHSEGLNSSRSEQHSSDQDVLRSNPLYQSSETQRGNLVQLGDLMYAEVPPAGLPDQTYEMIPGQSNTYESLEDVKSKKSKSTWGKKNIKWKKFLPDYLKK
ncbi:SH2 domain-containing protein 7 [Melanotaenia boesemani]|uniref:SH2 domain-containing protein 7 n=1 Tax=Melanotaenia boesemani TaxID=1250792 RepID=UPI001C03D90E|nr:SH2 domain-containing protein 7 [Melanotaenia boesemani]